MTPFGKDIALANNADPRRLPKTTILLSAFHAFGMFALDALVSGHYIDPVIRYISKIRKLAQSRKFLSSR